MADHLTKEKRSWNMSRIRSKDTKPEMIVRSLLHQMGYRFRFHRKDLPGKPDIVLPSQGFCMICCIFAFNDFWSEF
jgi:DNA mismatch endonuclease, patch repair protein